MGDRRRFDAFADLIARNITPDIPVADVAGGSGGLRAALHQRGFRDVDSWDKRHRNARGKKGYIYGLFDWRNAPRGYKAVVAMHPDEGTDNALLYALRERVPFIICPCCVKPSGAKFSGNQYGEWLEHLAAIGRAGRFSVTEACLPIRGRNIVLIGRPR